MPNPVQADVAAAVSWAVAEGVADPRRLAMPWAIGAGALKITSAIPVVAAGLDRDRSIGERGRRVVRR